jgi:hypothetical protein
MYQIIGCDIVSKQSIVPFQVVSNFETEQANPFAPPALTGFFTTTS